MIYPYLVVIKSTNDVGEIEWSETIEAATRKGARSKATRWIHRHLFDCDVSNIEKQPLTEHIEWWWLE